MATCKECFHCSACHEMYLLAVSQEDDFFERHDAETCEDFIDEADVVEVKKRYHEGDVCIYPCYSDGSSKSRAVVQITKILSEEKGIAQIKFLKVVVDDTGNGFFDYLYRTGKTMNASFKYLKNITPLSYEKKGEQNG